MHMPSAHVHDRPRLVRVGKGHQYNMSNGCTIMQMQGTRGVCALRGLVGIPLITSGLVL